MTGRTPFAHSAALCFSAALLAAAPLPAVVAGDDYLAMLEETWGWFGYQELLGNDETASFSPTVSITVQPEHGDLACAIGGCSYLPDAGFTGLDSFTYTVVDGTLGSDTAEVRIQVSPLLLPLVGDWDGDGVTDLGLFHGGFQDALLIGIDPQNLDFLGDYYECGQLPLPATAEGWTPLAGDWDGDGQAEVGIFDPADREYILYGRDPATGDWVEWLRFLHPVAGQGGAPVAGDWDGDGSDEVGLYLDAERRFLLLEATDDGVTVSHDVTFVGMAAGSWAPVAGEWGGDGDGVDTLGLWNPDTRELVIRFQNTTGPPQDWPFPFDSQHSVGPLPVAGAWGQPVSGGFFDPGYGGPGQALFALYPRAFTEDPILDGTVTLVLPPEDPFDDPCFP